MNEATDLMEKLPCNLLVAHQVTYVITPQQISLAS